MNTKSKVWLVTNEEFIQIINDSESINEVLTKLGLSNNGGGSRSVIKRRIELLGIDCSDLKLKIAKKRRQILKNIQEKSLEDIFSGKCEYVSTNSLKKRLIREGILEYKCDICGIDKWQNEKISLQLDHIDGERKNNSKENLRLLCPNCHSQTNTYAGKRNTKYRTTTQYSLCPKCDKKILVASKLCKNCKAVAQRKVVRPSKEDLEKAVWETPTMKLKEKYGVSDVAIAKWCKQYGINKPPRGYWTKLKQCII